MQVIMKCSDFFANNIIVTEIVSKLNGKQLNPIKDHNIEEFKNDELLFLSIDNIISIVHNVRSSQRTFNATQKGIKHQRNNIIEKTFEHSKIRISNRSLYLFDKHTKLIRKTNLDDIKSVEIKNNNLIIIVKNNKNISLNTNNNSINFQIILTIDTMLKASKKL